MKNINVGVPISLINNTMNGYDAHKLGDTFTLPGVNNLEKDLGMEIE